MWLKVLHGASTGNVVTGMQELEPSKSQESQQSRKQGQELHAESLLGERQQLGKFGLDQDRDQAQKLHEEPALKEEKLGKLTPF